MNERKAHIADVALDFSQSNIVRQLLETRLWDKETCLFVPCTRRFW